MNKVLSLAVVLFASSSAAAEPAVTGAGDFPSALTGPVLAAWIPSHTSIRLADVISVGGGRVIGLTKRSQPAGTAKAVRITVRTEIVDPAQAREASARSESSELDIDCAQDKAKLVGTQTYSQRDLRGTFIAKPGWSEFTSPKPGTTLGRMIAAACDPAFRGSFAAAPDAAAVKPGPPEKAAAPVDRFANLVQISASTSRAQAQASLDSLKRSLPALVADREASIEQTTVDGQTYYRAILGGFAGAADARALCTALKAAGGDCLVRQR